MLEGTGLAREYAETYLKVIEGFMNDNVATKEDLKELRNEFKLDNQKLRQEIQAVRNDLALETQSIRAELNTIEHRIFNRMGIVVATSTTLILGFMTFLFTFFQT